MAPADVEMVSLVPFEQLVKVVLQVGVVEETAVVLPLTKHSV